MRGLYARRPPRRTAPAGKPRSFRRLQQWDALSRRWRGDC